ncbi:hypothetical protein O1L55_40835 [Streptomyces albulus]|nr:hypothetical protein [Streptomyces noursei]
MAHDWPLHPGFWTDEFPQKTNDRTSPYLFKGIIPATTAQAEDVIDGLAAMRRAHAAGTASAAKARVYLGEERHDELVETVLTADPWKDGNFVPWMQQTTGAERFSLVLNGLETVSPALAAGLGTFLSSLFDGWGVPIGGAEQAVFAGNYSGTAFGVHEGSEDAFLCHLGPGIKDFYCWPADEYVKRTGGKDPLKGDYQWLLPYGEKFVMEPGDALFLPARVFHVGRQNTFSVSVAVPLYTYPERRFLRMSALPELLDTVLAEDPDNPFGDPSPMHDLSAGSAQVARRLAALAQSALDAMRDKLETKLADHVQDYWDAMLSNGGWEYKKDDLGRKEAAAAFHADQVEPGTVIRIPAPYQLRVTGPRSVFLRGIKTDLDTTALAPDIVTALNTRATMTLPDDRDLLAAVRTLGATGGIHLTPATTTKDAA